MEKRVLIINPNSGSGKSIEVGKCFMERFKVMRMPYSVYYTHNPEFTREYIDKFVKDEDIIYSIGGDGTLHEIANAIAKTNKTVCVVPSGTGNDLYKSLDQEPRKKKIDLGKVNDRYFINSFSIGVDADTSNNANEKFRIKMIPTSIKYKLALIYTIMKFKPKELSIEQKKKFYTLLTIANGMYYGGGFKVSPDSIIDDGYLEMLAATDFGKMDILKFAPYLAKGEHTNLENVEYKKIRELYIKSDVEINAAVDGELFIGTEFKIKVEPKAINILQEPFVETTLQMALRK